VFDLEGVFDGDSLGAERPLLLEAGKGGAPAQTHHLGLKVEGFGKEGKEVKEETTKRGVLEGRVGAPVQAPDVRLEGDVISVHEGLLRRRRPLLQDGQ
jgi:hypothetical protein